MTTAERYPLSWPHGWPRTAAHKRKRALFHSSDRNANGWREKRDLTIYAAMRRLTDELDRLGACSVLVSTNVETTRDGQPRSDRRAPDDPGVAVYFKLGGQDRVLACDKWDRVPGNIAAIAGHIDAIRRQERYGVGTLDQAFAGYAALPAPGQIAKRPWRQVLNVTEGGGIETAEINYRQLARVRHPDAGGSHDQMTELNEAIAEARKELSA